MTGPPSPAPLPDACQRCPFLRHTMQEGLRCDVYLTLQDPCPRAERIAGREVDEDAIPSWAR